MSTMQRRSRNRITRLCLTDDTWIEDEEQIGNSFAQFYYDLFTSSGSRSFTPVLEGLECPISNDDNVSLMQDISSEEVKAAVFDLGCSKALGPDGFTGAFYQKAWSIVGDQLKAAVEITRQQRVPYFPFRHYSRASLSSTSTCKSEREHDFGKPSGHIRKHSLSALDGISSFPHRPWLMNFSTTFSTSNFGEKAYHLSVEPAIDDGETLKLVSGSSCIPHPDKKETGGEDAHFICADEQAFGVADGVGGWTGVGVDSGLFSRELMSNSVRAIQEEPKGSINPARVLEKAHFAATAKGSSTACIIALAEKELHAINLGDSGFLVIRNGRTVFRSTFQQHNFNLTYQLESGNGADLPSAGEVYTVPVEKGDVVVAATDGLFDNLYANEVTSVIVYASRVGLEPKATAQKIAALAHLRAQEKNRMTPYSAAAQQAGFLHYGGKLDDITVIVSYIT